MKKSIVRFSYLVISPLLVIIFIGVGLGSNKQPSQASGDFTELTSTPTNTMVPTVTGWPSQTPTVTPSPIPSGTPSPTPTETSYPGPPILRYPPDGALMPQPVAPDAWYFSWIADCGVCTSGIHIEGPGGREISAGTDWEQEFQYTSETPIPEDALGPWFWSVGVCKPLGCNHSETRTFWVRGDTVSTTPVFRRYLPGVVQGSP